jgi:glucose-1-phosphate adenylyltransferase
VKEQRHSEKIITFIMAGGEGTRLRPLTDGRSKPAMPFGGRYRIVDFVLSNLINSEMRSIYLLVQYKAQSLIEHIRKAWTISPMLQDQFVTIVPPQMQAGQAWFQGTADAVYQNVNLLTRHSPDLVAVFGADHIYRMDVRQMVRFHQENRADVTIAALPVPIEQTASFGIIEAENDGRIRGFEEKPVRGKCIPSDTSRAYASMGNYLFSTKVLIEALEEANRLGETDFGRDVLPRLVGTHRLYAYNFADNRIPGIKPYEEAGYWRDVGTLDAYYEAHKDVMGLQPLFDAFNPQWPIFSSHYQGPVARVLDSHLDNCLLGTATLIERASVRNSIIRREVVIEPDVELEDCIIMDYVRICRGAKLRRVIVDRHNVIDANTTIGYDPQADRERYDVTPAGVVVIPRGRVDYYARDPKRGGPGYME